MTIINYLSDILAKKINISPSATRGLIKLSIKDQLGPYFDFNQVTYLDLKYSIENALKERLVRLKFDNIEDLIALLLLELKENQSLITMDKF
ncbi:MAG: hypothetical protein ACFFBP_15895 [Promethearchaeota archaeon]